jgi:hypothetical protein
MKDIIHSPAFESLPIGWKVFFGIIIALFLAFGYLLNYQGFRTLVGNMFVKMFRLASKEPLLMHVLFFNRSYYYSMINKMSFTDAKKTDLFVILAKNKVDTTIDMTKDFIKQHTDKLNEYNTMILRDLMFDLRYNIIKTSSQLSMDRFVEIYGRDKGLKLWGMIYESENGYKKYWEDKNVFINKNIERIIISKTRNNEESLRSILTQIDICIDLSILDCEDTFESLNGNISEIING